MENSYKDIIIPHKQNLNLGKYPTIKELKMFIKEKKILITKEVKEK
jgi:hypothetical protein